MKKPFRLIAALALATAVPALARGEVTPSPRLAPLKPLLKTWRGSFPESTAEKPMVDVSTFELALNGQAVRNRHSINDGVYGGESFIFWDAEKQSLVYYYFTTAGFYTSGTLREEGGALVAHEVVKGNAGGVSEVKAVYRVLPDGRLHVKTQHLKEGKWVDGRDMHYVAAPSAVVRFKE